MHSHKNSAANCRLLARALHTAFLVVMLMEGIVEAHAASITQISSNSIHLGGEKREWAIFKDRKPQGEEFRLKFESKANSGEHTLIIRQDDVKQDWVVNLNGKKLGSLFLMEADLVHMLAIPPNTLRDGENELHIMTKVPEDILIHSISIANDSRSNLLSVGKLIVRVLDADGKGMPARITIVDTNGTLAAIQGTNENLAIRPGVVYSGDGNASLNVLPGKYVVYANRGPEYSMGRSELSINPVGMTQFTLKREVVTEGWVASDTHIHTLSLSKHGDAQLKERILTLAGEAIELPVATEHNLHADYSEAAKAAGFSRYFTTVPGNEVTTTNGHFNIFPITLDSSPVDHRVTHWPKLIENMRKSPAVQMVILNHPTDTHSGFTPFAATNLNPLTGKNLRGDFAFEFDGMELINSGAMRSDWMEPFRAWFALLNRGYKIVGVGSSDSHDVSRFIVGQGRTYVQVADANPGSIDVAKACEALKNGRAVVSLGLFPQLRILEKGGLSGVSEDRISTVGDLHISGEGDFLEFEGSVDFPTWMNPEEKTETILYANGRPIRSLPFNLKKRPGVPHKYKVRLPKPKTDTWYVLIAHSPGVTNAYWSIARPYQPSSPEWTPAMIGATNPIWVDADRDGRFTAPRLNAKRVIDANRSPELVIAELAKSDWATAVQAAELLHDSGVNIRTEGFQKHLRSAPEPVQTAFTDYLKTIAE